MINSIKSFYNADGQLRDFADIEQFRPKNLPREIFYQSPDLKYVAGPFSTFDVRLSRMVRGGASQSDIDSYAIHSLPNLSTVAADYVINILRATHNFQEAWDLLPHCAGTISADLLALSFYMMAIDLNRIMGISNKDLKVMVVDSWAETPSILVPKAEERLNIYGKYVHSKLKLNSEEFNLILIHRGNLAREIGPQNQNALYIAIMDTFAHEFSHFVDTVAPNLGALGAQIAALDTDNPKEFSAHNIGTVMKHALLRGIRR